MAHQNFTGLTLHQNNKIPRLAECLSDGDFYYKVSDFLFAYSGNYVILHNFPNKHMVVIGKLCKFAQKSE